MPRAGPDMAALDAIPGTGLKIPSMIGFDKLATLERAAIAGKIGDAPVEWLPLTARLFSRFSVSGSGNGRESLARKLGARRGASYLMPQILPMQSSKAGPKWARPCRRPSVRQVGLGDLRRIPDDEAFGVAVAVPRLDVANRVAAAGEPVVVLVVVEVRNDGAVAHLGHG